MYASARKPSYLISQDPVRLVEGGVQADGIDMADAGKFQLLPSIPARAESLAKG